MSRRTRDRNAYLVSRIRAAIKHGQTFADHKTDRQRHKGAAR